MLNSTASCGDYNSARDIHGHGTHVAGTSAGSVVPYAINNGIDMGSPRGAAFGARLVAYKVFWCGSGAYSGDISNAIDTGVKDGVDVLSLSLGHVILQKHKFNHLSTSCLVSILMFGSKLWNSRGWTRF